MSLLPTLRVHSWAPYSMTWVIFLSVNMLSIKSLFHYFGFVLLAGNIHLPYNQILWCQRSCFLFAVFMDLLMQKSLSSEAQAVTGTCLSNLEWYFLVNASCSHQLHCSLMLKMKELHRMIALLYCFSILFCFTFHTCRLCPYFSSLKGKIPSFLSVLETLSSAFE